MKYILTSLLSICLLNLLAQNTDNEQRLKVPVESTVVYLDGAEVTHNKTVTLEAGRNSIVFTGISSHLISKSVQINAGSDASILSISDKINYLNRGVETPKIKNLKDSLKLLRETLDQLSYEKEAYVTEKKMIVDNEVLGGREKAVAIAELKLAADFYRSRIKEINVEIFKLDKKMNPCYDIIARLDKEINECNGKLAAPTAEITVLLSAATKLTTKIELKYLLSDAGWAPSYDLIAEDVNKPIELKYRAKVFNNTDVDWNNVKLKLSTSDPSLNASK
ncbi:MAG TPA: mucoidy inhibitor MuiA family protein, partial [Bacteroidia bacterium]|nr:mucoidy inhibitor MuiA family protein [Bacteroidia bacterium]